MGGVLRSTLIQQITVDQLSLTRECAFGFFHESGLPGKFNWQHWQRAWTDLLEKGIGVIFANVRDGRAVGVLGGIRANCLNTGDLETFETFWYVLPEYRKGPLAIRLLRQFENWSNDIGAKRIKMAYLTDLSGERVRAMYKALGYTEQETTFRKDLV